MIKTNKLYFEVIPTNNCNTLAIVDLSTYATDVEGATLQVALPDSSVVRELIYNVGRVTVLNSNSLGYTNVANLQDLEALPDGAYTIKISVCPYESNWFEKDIYRVCKLQCKYYKAILTLDLAKCENCYDPNKLKKLREVELYISGIIANTEIGDINTATELYEVANKILDNIIDCNC